MGLLERISASRAPAGQAARSSSFDWWANQVLGQFMFGGNTYPYGLNTTLSNRIEEISRTLPGYAAALRGCPPAFAAQLVRAMVLSQARFTWRNLPSSGSPRRTFGTRELGVLERPWPNATTGELLSRMEWHAGLAGNAFVVRQERRLRVLRPDWVTLVFGSEQEPDDAAHALDGELIGYVYQNGGMVPGNRNTAQVLLPDEVAHWSPIPDPEAAGLGMSWVTAALLDIRGDRGFAEHKLKFLEQGATPNLVVKGIPATTKAQFDELVEMMESRHAGLANAYRTLYLTVGADATVVGSDLKQLDFKQVQGAGETRISMLGRVPAALLGISQGLEGSSLNAGNFNAARRIFGDLWVYPTLQDLAACLAAIVQTPGDAELWYDAADIPLLREDGKDAAEIEQVKANTIRQLVDGGFEPESVVAAVQAQDMSLLVHSGLVSVQLNPPGSGQDDSAPDAGAVPATGGQE